MSARRWAVGTALWLALCLGAATAPRAEAVVGRMNHLSFSDAGADALFARLTAEFELPVVWPMASYGAFSSGGVYAGGVVLEIGHIGAPSPMARLLGVAFDPAVSAQASLAEMDRRGIGHSPPQPGPTAVAPQWVNVFANGIGPPRVQVFVCDYAKAIAPDFGKLDAALAAKGGGPLGVVGVREVVFEARDLKAAADAWKSLLAPVAEKGQRLALPMGPAIRLTPGAEDRLVWVILEVRSLAAAKAYLRAHAIAFEEQGGAVSLAKSLEGLPLTLVAKR